MTPFQIRAMKMLEYNLVYCIRILASIAYPALDDVSRQRLAQETLDQLRSNMKG